MALSDTIADTKSDISMTSGPSDAGKGSKMDENTSFGRWLKRRRRSLDLTQEDLAQRSGYSVSAIRKVEADVIRPSKQLAERLAPCLDLAPEQRPRFLRFARDGARGEGATLAGDRSQLPLPHPASRPPTFRFLLIPSSGARRS